MNEWKVIYTEEAEKDLSSIFEYIAFSLVEKQTARNQVRRIMNGISKLNSMPERNSLHKGEPWQSKGLRVLVIDSYNVYYTVQQSDNTVVVVRIFYGGRDIEVQLNDSSTFKVNN